MEVRRQSDDLVRLGSPVGVGLFIVSIGAFLVLLHYAGIVR
jgi:hypothetical protein